MKILLITPLYPGYIGQSPIESPYVVHYIAKQWVEDYDVQVIRLWPHYPSIFNYFKKAKKIYKYSDADNFMLDKVDVFRVPIKKVPKCPYSKKEINKAVDEIISNVNIMDKPDIIICDTLNPSIYIGEILSKKFNSLLVASLHNTDIKILSRSKDYKKFLSLESSIDKIVFRSPVVERKFFNLYSGTKGKKDFFNMLFGLDNDVYIDNKTLKRKISRPEKVVIVAAQLIKLKKIDVLIQAFCTMQNNNKYILRIIGDGPERKNLEELTKSLGYEKQIIFEGEKPREEVLDLMEKAEIFAMVSSPETFGLVYLEAMAKGCLTVGSIKEGIDGVIKNDYNGFLAIPDDVENLKSILDKIILLSEDERGKIIYNALKTAHNFSNKKLAEEYINKIQM